MSLDLYDQNGWVGIVARGDASHDLFDIPSTAKLMSQGYADAELVKEMIDDLEIEHTLAATTLQALLKQSTPPVLISDSAGDPRIEKFDDPNPQPTSEDEYAWAGIESILTDQGD